MGPHERSPGTCSGGADAFLSRQLSQRGSLLPWSELPWLWFPGAPGAPAFNQSPLSSSPLSSLLLPICLLFLRAYLPYLLSFSSAGITFYHSTSSLKAVVDRFLETATYSSSGWRWPEPVLAAQGAGTGWPSIACLSQLHSLRLGPFIYCIY